MSHRTEIVEEFDDDTDLPLPNLSLPNTGPRGAILEEISSSDDESDGSSEQDVYGARYPPGPASPASQSQFRAPGTAGTVTDITPYKSCVLHHHLALVHFAPAGHVSIQSTSMQRDLMELASVVYPVRNVSGGHFPKTLQMLLIVSD
jgi:hypothetical protein